MKTWVQGLSQRQLVVFSIVILIAVIIVTAGFLMQPPAKQINPAEFSMEMSLREAAHKLGVTGAAFARELGLNIDVSKTDSISSLGIARACPKTTNFEGLQLTCRS